MRGRQPAVQLTDEEWRLAAVHSRAYRRAHNMTQLDLAVLLRCHPAAISEIEREYRERNSRIAAAILRLRLPATGSLPPPAPAGPPQPDVI